MLGRTRASSKIKFKDQSQNEDQFQIEERFQIERKIADEIMDTIHRLQLPFKLDQLTEGLGNCFPIAIIQQLRRPEIFSQLRTAPKRLVKHQTGHSLLRQSVHQFIMKSRSPRVVSFKAQYEETDGPENGTWNQYWTRMTTDRTWVDFWFVQATAWYLQLDIWIIATSSTESNPYIEVSGNLADGTKPSGGPVITLGTKSNCHYQSLLPVEMFHLEFKENQQNSTNTLPGEKVTAELKPSRNNKKIQGKDEREFKSDEPHKNLHHTHSDNNEDGLLVGKDDMNATKSYMCSYVCQKTTL